MAKRKTKKSSQPNCDVLIIGAGPVGSIAARLLAEKDLHCIVLDKRSHIAGNCYDEVDNYGVLIHKYGPHYFRTDDDDIIHFLSRFTEWVPGNYVVKSQFQNELYPFPINLTTLEMIFGKNLDEESAKEELARYQLHYPHPENSEEFVLSRVGQRIYEMFYLGYTLKQWDRHPRELAPSVCGRIPIRFDRNDKYVNQKHQLMPKHGYTQMYQNIIRHPKIDLRLDTDYFKVKSELKAKYATIYTGPIDLYFNKKLGELSWRSLDFEFHSFENKTLQPCVQINYPEAHVPYTRTVEIKHTNGQLGPNTTISTEFPKPTGEPYYPIPSDETQKLYLKYKELADKEKAKNNVYFAGRLAEYTYINMDQAIERGLSVAQEICQRILKEET